MCVRVCVHTHTCVCGPYVCRRRLLSLGTGLQVVVRGWMSHISSPFVFFTDLDFNFLFYFMCLGVLPTRRSMHHPYAVPIAGRRGHQVPRDWLWASMSVLGPEASRLLWEEPGQWARTHSVSSCSQTRERLFAIPLSLTQWVALPLLWCHLCFTDPGPCQQYTSELPQFPAREGPSQTQSSQIKLIFASLTWPSLFTGSHTHLALYEF